MEMPRFYQTTIIVFGFIVIVGVEWRDGDENLV